jgi:3-dehydroquinate dehydratase / shikimate dehydrogenase
MNNGKICVSICTETADELIKLLRRAEEVADVIEVRLDGLKPDQVAPAFDRLQSEKTILLTIRPKSQGGKTDYNIQDRMSLWTHYAMHKKIDHKAIWIDHETDLIPKKEFLFWAEDCFVIRSQHDMDGVPDDLNKVYDRTVSDTEVGKIAVQAKDITDTIGIWNLLKRANEEGKKLIPITMGEAGKWTRILGSAHGAFMTYAALETGSETAPGQISVEDMTDVFRVKEHDENTGVYGIVAGNTSYSVSPWMHNAAFKAAGLNSVFVPLQVADLGAFFSRMVLPETREVDLSFKGFSVTNPHKQTIIPFLDEVDETAARIGAVNTVKIEDGKLYGYNTDAPGFVTSLKQAFGDLAGVRVAVYGAGGAARACIYSLQQEGAVVTLVGRNQEKGQMLADEFEIEFLTPSSVNHPLAADFDIVVNATPLGTAGSSVNFAILEAEQLRGIKFVYDLVYNPSETTLIREAKAAGVPTIGGLEMLIAQGVKQFEIWTGSTAPIDAMRAAVRKRLQI